MPPKKLQTSKKAESRTRSKSVGRAESKSRTSRSRSRSRSRVASPKPSKARQAASETKIRRRSVSTSSSTDPSPPVLRPRKPKTSDDGSKRRQTLASRDSDVKLEILRGIESRFGLGDTVSNHTRSHEDNQPASTGCKLACLVKTYICDSPLVNALCFLSMIPFIYWINLLVFARQSGTSLTTIWGPAKPFAYVLWPTDWKAYVCPYVFLAVSTFYFLHLLVALIPIGVSHDKGTRYRSNGIIALVLIGALFYAAQWSSLPQFKNIRPGTVLPKQLLRLLTASIFYIIVGSFVNYFASKRATSQLAPGVPRNAGFVHNFFVGRVLRPSGLGIEWKLLALRVGLTGMLLMDFLYLSASFTRFGKVSPALVAAIIMRSIAVVDFVFKEHTMMYTFETGYEPFGFGLMFAQLVFVPFFYTIGSAYAFANPDLGWVFYRGTVSHELVYLWYAVAFTVFVVGYYFYRAANSQKDNFRRNPSLAPSACVVGHDSHRLLCGGLWGMVRHPNYLGDIMSWFAQAIPAGFVSIFPWILPITLVAFFVHRIERCERACAKKHRTVWTQYTRVVPYKLVPKVY